MSLNRTTNWWSKNSWS